MTVHEHTCQNRACPAYGRPLAEAWGHIWGQEGTILLAEWCDTCSYYEKKAETVVVSPSMTGNEAWIDRPKQFQSVSRRSEAISERFRRLYWKPWAVELVGLWSGHRTTMRFVRFWNREKAQAWCDAHNSRWHEDVEYRPIDLRIRNDSGKVTA